MLNVLLFLLASSAIALASVAAAATLTARGVLVSLLAFALIVWTSIVVITGIAGIVVHSLSASWLTALSFGWLVLAVGAAWRTGALRRLPARIRGGGSAAVASLGWAPTAIAAVLLLLVLAWRTVLAVRLPVVDGLGWQYHLVLVDTWLQADAIVRVPQNVWTDGWPATGELLTTWLAAFTRTDALTGFTGLIGIPLLVLGTTGFARVLGATRRSALLVGLLAGMIPAASAMAGTTYVDTASTAAVVASWWLGTRGLRGQRDRSAAVMLGIAAGLAFGTKATSVALVLPILVAVGVAYLVDLARAARTREGAGRVATAVALLVVPVIVLGGSWYLKNLVLHANPLYPVQFGPFDGPMPAGTFGAPPVPADLRGLDKVGQIALSWAADWRFDNYLYNTPLGGFGLAWLVVVTLAVGGLVLLVRRRQLDVLALIVLPASVALVVLTSPWYARYTLYVPAGALAVAAIVLDVLRPRWRTILGLTLVGLATVSLAISNLGPNVPGAGLAAGRVPRLTDYLRLVTVASDARRAGISLRGECDELAIIPPGSRVTVEPSYFVPHAVVGPNLDRVLTDPIAHVADTDVADVATPGVTPVGDAAALVAALRDRRSGWLVTSDETHLQELAASDPEHLRPRGDVCRNGRLWEVIPESPS